MANDAGEKPREDIDSLLQGLLNRDDKRGAIAYLGGALQGLAEISKPAKYQRDIALKVARTASLWLEANREA